MRKFDLENQSLEAAKVAEMPKKAHLRATLKPFYINATGIGKCGEILGKEEITHHYTWVQC